MCQNGNGEYGRLASIHSPLPVQSSVVREDMTVPRAPVYGTFLGMWDGMKYLHVVTLSSVFYRIQRYHMIRPYSPLFFLFT